MPRKTKRLTMPRRKRTDLKIGLYKDRMEEEDTSIKGLDDVSEMLGALDFIVEEDKIKQEKRRIAALKKEEKEMQRLIKEKEDQLKKESKLKSVAKNTSKHRITRKMRKEIDNLEKKGEVLDLDNLIEIMSNVGFQKGGKRHTRKVHHHKSKKSHRK